MRDWDDLEASVRKVVVAYPDFPKPGILFRDLMPLFHYPFLLREVADWMNEELESLKVTDVAAIESRGFLFGAPLAMQSGVKFVPIRKKGKLAGPVTSVSYDLEYGKDTLEVQVWPFQQGTNFVIIDDVLATGGTAVAAIDLLRKCGANPLLFLTVVELSGLEGSKRIEATGVRSKSLVKYS